MIDLLPRKDFKNIVVLSLYDCAYCASFMEDGYYYDLDAPLVRDWYIKKIGKVPELTHIDDLMNIYPEGTKIIICGDGCIETNMEPRRLFVK